jgi:SRSO17 transposase
MTEQEVSRIGPEFSAYLGHYRSCFLQDRTAAHFDNYCRGLLADLPRKSVEPIALECGTAVRTLQAFLTTYKWDHEQARRLLQRDVARQLDDLSRAATTRSQQRRQARRDAGQRDKLDARARLDERWAAAQAALGRVGVIDETSAVKKGEETPGVQRQYCGTVGKIENCIVTVHIAVVQGNFKTLLEADLYLPESWDADRERCRAAGIPEDVVYRAKWEIARDQLIRLAENDIEFAWLTFDEGYGSKVPFLEFLNAARQRFAAEVPKSFAVRTRLGGAVRRADEAVPARDTKSWRRFRLARQTLGHQVWRAKALRVFAAGRAHRLIVAINESTGEVKYFLSNAPQAGLARTLRVAFTRWNVEHLFRVAKQEVGLTHYEGRDYTGLMRHLILGLIVMGFVSQQATRKRGEKSTDHIGANLPSLEQPLPSPDASASRNDRNLSHQPCDPIPSAA